MANIGFGIIGCGMIARFHAQAIRALPDARLAAVQSRHPANAAAVMEAAGVRCEVYDRVEDLVTRPDIDVVIICTPSGAHLESALAAAQAGKHVVVEKPLEITLERCDRMIEACDRAGVRLCTIFPSRYADANRELKRALDAGRFGRLTLGEAACKWWRSQAYYDDGGWKGTRALDGGGAFMNQAIHSVDLLQWMMGPVRRVAALTATLAHERIEVEDTGVACLEFQSGALGVLQAATSVYPGLPKTIAIHGDGGSAVVEQEDVVRWDFREPIPQDVAVRERYAARVAADGGSSSPAAISFEYHRRQLEDFLEALNLGRRSPIDGLEGRKSIEIVLAIYESSRKGRNIQILE